ncbi:MAG: MlaE family ABC transporter permease [Flavobacteriales bacterium]
MEKIISFIKRKSFTYKVLKHTGAYFLLLGRVFKKPEKVRIYKDLIIREIHDLGTSSFGIVSFVAIFVGAVIALQMRNQLSINVLLGDYLIGYSTKEILILEFAPTMISVILVGKVGSFISSSIGTMRVTEQIDVLDVMGINSASFLILPKIIASIFCFPLLIMLSIVLGIFGGWLIGVITGYWATVDYIEGLQVGYSSFNIFYSIFKSFIFAFVIATVPSYHGYFVEGGSLDVGRASTTAVVWTSVLIIILDLVITQLMLG